MGKPLTPISYGCVQSGMVGTYIWLSPTQMPMGTHNVADVSSMHNKALEFQRP